MSDCRHRQEITELRERVVVLEQWPPRVDKVEKDIKALSEAVTDELHSQSLVIGKMAVDLDSVAQYQKDSEPYLQDLRAIKRLLVLIVFIAPTMFLALDYFQVTPFQAVDQIKQAEQTKGASHESANRST